MIASLAVPPRPKRVLILKPSALGDVVTALPVLGGLRRSFPDCRVAWMVSDACAGLIAHDSRLDEVILFERRRLGRAWRSASAAAALVGLVRGLRRRRFDWVIDLQGLLRSGLLSFVSRSPVRAGFADARESADLFYTHVVRPAEPHTVDRNIALARSLGVDCRPDDMRLEVSAAGIAFADTFCSTHHIDRGQFLVCVPSTTWATKRYPVRHWRSVVSRLAGRIPIVLTGLPSERGLCEAVAEGIAGVTNLAGRTSAAELVGLIAASAGVVCCDSAAKFIAPAVGVDCLVLIGPTRVERTGPYLGGRAVVAKVPCQGCLKRRCRHITCMQMIDPDEVAAAAQAMVER